jgi:hypothetical protein
MNKFSEFSHRDWLTQRGRNGSGRYHLRAPYLRFYFRFIEPNLEMVELGLTDAARFEAQAVGALLVDVDRLDTDSRI